MIGEGLSGDIGATAIKRLLAEKHARDVFVAECKTGPTNGYGNSLLILDAWAMKRSWANPAIYGYEIKADRSDFLRDEKWHGYIQFCNYFSFVAPRGVIEPTELPDGVGLLVAASTGSRLLTKRKPARREIEAPVDVFQYILQSRAVIGRDLRPTHQEDYWRSWLSEKEEKRQLGYRVGRAIRDHVERVEKENAQLTAQIKAYDEIIAWMEREGLRVDTYSPTYNLEEQRKRFAELVPRELAWRLRDARKAIEALTALLEKHGTEG